MNIQIAATLDGRLAAVGLIPVHGARAFNATGLAALLAGISTVADLGYVGVEGIDIVPFKRLPGEDLTTTQAEFNTALSKIRDHLIKNVPRASRKEVHRHKAYGHTTNHQTG